MKRQQQYMTGFFKKLQEKVKANPNYANEVLKVCRMFPQQILL